MQHLPLEAVSFGVGVSRHDLLLMDIVYVLTGEKHPSDPRRKQRDAKPPREALVDARARFAQRRRELGISGSVLRPKGD